MQPLLTLLAQRTWAAALWFIVGGCVHPVPDPASSTGELSEPDRVESPFSLLSHELPGVPEYLELLPGRLSTGGQPVGDAAFSALAERGIQTVVCVDGAIPDADLARKYGIRTVHIPLSYDSVPSRATAALFRVAQEAAEGAVYVHCHHGHHRGPAAAAVLGRILTGATGAQARVILETAGTSKDYPGLWADVEGWSSQVRPRYLPELVEAATLEDLTAGMAALDRTWDQVLAVRQAGWAVPDHHPDLVPEMEMERANAILFDCFSKSPKNLQGEVRFQTQALEAVVGMRDLRKGMRVGKSAKMESGFQRVEAACVACHRVYRN